MFQPTKKTNGVKSVDVSESAPRKLFVSVFNQMYSTRDGAEFGVYGFVAEVGNNICGFRWRSINPGVRLADMEFGGFPYENTSNFYVWENLGCGVSGRAFLVSSKSIASPVVGVIKCFFSEGNTGFKEEKQKVREQAQVNLRKRCGAGASGASKALDFS